MSTHESNPTPDERPTEQSTGSLQAKLAELRAERAALQKKLREHEAKKRTALEGKKQGVLADEIRRLRVALVTPGSSKTAGKARAAGPEEPGDEMEVDPDPTQAEVEKAGGIPRCVDAAPWVGLPI